MLPTRFADLPDYAFPRLRKLLDSHDPGGEPISMSIGEPQHPFPDFVGDVLADEIEGFGKYPPNDGTPELLGAIADWLRRRYGVALGPERILPLNGTREGLYNAAMALCPEDKAGQMPAILTPNPFYQVYAVAALSVSAEPIYVPATRETGFLPDYAGLSKSMLDRTALAYLCSPSNPQGAVADEAYWAELLTLAERHDFIVLADECYSEIYREGARPTGALEVSAKYGFDPERLVVFHSLSKRSNVPGLRSGFAAGGAQAIARMSRLRAYAGAPLPLPLQRVAERLWADDRHVVENRALYAQKYRDADRILGALEGYAPPAGGFFLWLPVDDGETAALKLWTRTGVRVLPGLYLGRSVRGVNPGKGFIRVAMVAPAQEFARGLTLLRDCLYG